ncbi:MAG TPA: hypothetical protein VGG99_19685 [Acetobacteraceae bacterium]
MNNVAGGGGSPQDRGMEARIAVLEEIATATRQSVVELRTDTNRRFDEVNRRFDTMRDIMERDFRLLFGIIVTVALGLAALMAKGFHWF